MELSTDETVLPNTALCAIVRDEIRNCAGGIIDFIDSTVPFVEEAIIVDGLSTDGTREALEELERKHPNLQILDRQFDTFPSQRNYSLDQAKNDYVLILDADELLTEQDFRKIREQMQERPAWGYIFKFLEHTPENPSGEIVPGNGLRLFRRSKDARYQNNPFEYLYLNGTRPEDEDANVTIYDAGALIKHFLPDKDSYEFKNTHWYSSIVGKGRASEIGPNNVPESMLWKEYNSARDKYRE